MARRGRGELEARVMDVLWAHDEPMTPRDVHSVVSTTRRPLAYTTVMTILVRLWEKRMLVREERGRAFAYRPVAGRDEWTAGRMHELLEHAGDPASALTHFVQSIDAREAAQLRRALDGRRRK
ncbi:MAG: BlaI/MecI/CopY family transcriptional regulator [Acidimicrobiia bacterium]